MYVGSNVDQQQRFTEIHNTYISTKYMIGMLLDVSTTSWQFGVVVARIPNLAS